MDEKLIQEIDDAALRYFNAKNSGNKNDELKYRNVAWILIYNHYSKRLTSEKRFDEMNRAALSCFDNWDGQNSFAHYISKSVSIALKKNSDPNQSRSKLKTVPLISEDENGEEYNVADVNEVTERVEYNISDNYADALKTLTVAVEVQNRMYLTKKTFNYYRLFYTETVALLYFYGIGYKDIKRLENKIMATVSTPFAKHFKKDSCEDLSGLVNSEFKSLDSFTSKAEDTDKSCLINKNTMLHSMVYLSFLDLTGKSVSVAGLSQQRTKYNDMREKIKKTEWLNN